MLYAVGWYHAYAVNLMFECNGTVESHILLEHWMHMMGRDRYLVSLDSEDLSSSEEEQGSSHARSQNVQCDSRPCCLPRLKPMQLTWDPAASLPGTQPCHQLRPLPDLPGWTGCCPATAIRWEQGAECADLRQWTQPVDGLLHGLCSRCVSREQQHQSNGAGKSLWIPCLLMDPSAETGQETDCEGVKSVVVPGDLIMADSRRHGGCKHVGAGW